MNFLDFPLLFRHQLLNGLLMSFGLILAPFWHPLAPICSLLARFGSHLVPFGIPLAPFRSLVAPFSSRWRTLSPLTRKRYKDTSVPGNRTNVLLTSPREAPNKWHWLEALLHECAGTDLLQWPWLSTRQKRKKPH